mgnify:CR=1 FL=1
MKKNSRKYFIGAFLIIGAGVFILKPGGVWSAEEEDTEPLQGTFTAVPAGSSEAVPMDQQLKPSSLGLDELVSLDLRNIEAADALRFLAQKGGMNLAISKNVSGRVQLLLDSVPIRDILDIILITNALAYEKIGEVYYIMTETEYKERFGRKFSDTRQVKVFKLQYAVPEQVFSLFDVLKSEIGRLLVDPDSGTVLVMDTLQNIEKMEVALKSMEQKKTVKVYPLKYGNAADVESRLKTRLDAKKVGSAVADERTNSVIVDTLPERMGEIDGIVESLDQKTREVLVDAKVIKVTISNGLAAEIKWEGLYKQMAKTSELFVGNAPFAALARTAKSTASDFVRIPPTTTPPTTAKNVLTENLVFGSIGEDTFEVLMNFLRTIGETKILSNPKIACVSGQEAKILVGQKQAYVTTTTTTSSGGGSTVAENVTFIDVGIQLAVTPVVNEDGFVTMKIKPEVSSVGSNLITPSGNTIPIVDTSTAETTVMVRDGVSILIGGLRRDEKTENRKKIPFLGDIPFLGAPFNSFTNSVSHTELLILITPHIVYGTALVTGETKAVDRLFKSYSEYSTNLDMKKVAFPTGADLAKLNTRKADAVKNAAVRT